MDGKNKLIALMLTLFMVLVVFTGCAQTPTTISTPETNAPAPAAEASGDATETVAEDSSAATVPEKVYELKLAHHMPLGHVYTNEAQWFADQVAVLSNGGVKITVYPAEQLGDEDSASDGVISGAIDLAFVGPGVIGSRYKPLTILECCYLFRDVDHLMATCNSDIGKELAAGTLAATGARMLCIPYYGTRHVTTSTKPINSVEDIKNLKLRCPNEQMITACWSAMGAAPTPMSLSEVYMALSQNAVDGQENPFPTIIAQKFYEVQDYICLSGHTVQTLPLFINEKVFQSLPEEYQEIIVEVAAECGNRITQGILDCEATQLDELKGYGMTVTNIDVEPLRQAILEKVVPQFEAEWGKGLFERIQAVK